MKSFNQLNSLLLEQSSATSTPEPEVYAYASAMASIENVIAVVSDMTLGKSKIFCGAFAKTLGLSPYREENSIWEKKILALMPDDEKEAKFITELRYYHYLRKVSKNRQNYFLMTKLRFRNGQDTFVNVLHRMYYVFDEKEESVKYAICLYGPLTIDFKGRSLVVNSLTGLSEELTDASDACILTRRETQVLGLISRGMKSEDIAHLLHISRHTVNRHRQEILAKLQVKNSIEACRVARSMSLL